MKEKKESTDDFIIQTLKFCAFICVCVCVYIYVCVCVYIYFEIQKKSICQDDTGD